MQERVIATPPGMTHFKLPVKQGKLLFYGNFYAEENNDTGDRLRWAALRAYGGFGIEPDSETYGKHYYLLYAVGHSLVVHDPQGCRGTLAPVSRFPDLNEDWEDLEACPECSPDFLLGASPPDAEFKLEVTRYSHTQYTSAMAFTDSLRKCRTCGHRPHDLRPECGCGCQHYAKGDFSQIGERLLAKVRVLDEAVDSVMPAEIRL